MSDTKWLSEDERQMLEGHLWYSHAQIYAREFASRLAAERDKNAELLRRLICTERELILMRERNAELVEALGDAVRSMEICKFTKFGCLPECREVLAKNGGQP